MLIMPGTVVNNRQLLVNLDNLNKKSRSASYSDEGTHIVAQEIHAELIDAEEGGIVQRSTYACGPDVRSPYRRSSTSSMSLNTAFREETTTRRAGDRPGRVQCLGRLQVQGRGDIMLLDCGRRKLSFPDTVDTVHPGEGRQVRESDKRPCYTSPKVPGWVKGPRPKPLAVKSIDVIVIEEKASGKSLRQQLLQDGIFDGWI